MAPFLIGASEAPRQTRMRAYAPSHELVGLVARSSDREMACWCLRRCGHGYCRRARPVWRFVRQRVPHCCRHSYAPPGPDLPRGGDAVHRRHAAAAWGATRRGIWSGLLPPGASSCHGESPDNSRKAWDLQTASGGQPRSHSELDNRSQCSFVRRPTEPLVVGQWEPVSDLPGVCSQAGILPSEFPIYRWAATRLRSD
jgi:hypothetical protein